MSKLFDEFIAPLLRKKAKSHETVPMSWRSLQLLEPEQFAELMTVLSDHLESLDAHLNSQQWQVVFGALLQRCGQLAMEPSIAKISEEIAKMYRKSAALGFPRYQLLTCLASLANVSALQRFVDLICEDPPIDQAGATTPFLPLMQESLVTRSESLFPALFDGLQHPQVAPAVIDLANFFARNHPQRTHPGGPRAKKLIQLLEGVTRQLEDVQDRAVDTGASGVGHREASEDSGASSEAIAHAIALAISLCDALALIGDESASAALSHAMQLRHRRLQLEAASALARLGDGEGKNALLSMAAEPSLRLRVLKYAEELGIDDEIDDQFSTGAAIAEAQLVTYLAAPQQFGVAPTSCELVEATTLYWPGYEEPRDCYVFRFSYQAVGEEGQVVSLANLGIAGPLTHTVHADLTQLSQRDVLAMFAGWHAEHNQIGHRAIDYNSTLDTIDQQLVAALEEGPYEQVELCISGKFFDDRVVVATATKAGQPGLAVSAADGVSWFAQTSEQRPLSAEDAFSIYKGRRLLASFND